MAPDATLAVGKVLSDQGSGTESQIIAGMEWAAKDIHARIVSMSLGSSEGSDGTDPMAEAVNTLSKETGALFVIAAGNAGSPAPSAPPAPPTPHSRSARSTPPTSVRTSPVRVRASATRRSSPTCPRRA